METERKCQLVGALGFAKSFCDASSKLRDKRGQYSGIGQRVKKNVMASAFPRKLSRVMGLPNSFVNGYVIRGCPPVTALAAGIGEGAGLDTNRVMSPRFFTWSIQ